MRQIRHAARALGILLLLALPAAGPAHAAEELAARITFDIPAGPLSAGVLRYSAQSGIQVTSPSQLLSGLRTSGVHGRQSARAALGALLAGTGLTFEVIDGSTVAIRPAERSRAEVGLAGARGVSAEGGRGDAAAAPQEIIVSARKQTESLLTVPQSITTYPAQTLASFDIRSFPDYATLTPNLSFSYGTGQLGFATSRAVAIRGIGGSGTTAFYIDDTPVPESVDPRVVDIERIEILKGPQGTLYGQSSLGGSVRMVTAQPSFTDAQAHAAVQLGGTAGGAGPDYGGDLAGTFVAVPDRIAVRVVGFVNQEAGFLTRTFPVAGGATGADSGQGAVLTRGGSLSIRVRATPRLDISLRIMAQAQSDHGWPATWAQLPGFLPASYSVARIADVQELAADDWYLPSLQVSYRGNGWSLSSSTSYFNRRAHDVEDGTEGTDDELSLLHGITLALRPIPWDGYYSDHRVVHETRVSFDTAHGVGGVLGVYLSKVVDAGILDSHDIPGIAAAGLWPTDLGWYSLNENEARNIAVFGELRRRLGHFELTLGLRGYRLRQSGRVLAEGALNGQVTDQPLQATSQQGVSPKLALSYKPSPDTLVFGLASSGFRGGGAGRVLPSICEPFPVGMDLQPGRPVTYGSDSIWSYEIGARAQLHDSGLLVSGSLFQMNWTDIQQTITLPKCFITFVTNAGAARARGGELEVSGHPWPALEMRTSAGFDDAVITSEGFSRQAVGSRVYQIPRWTWAAGGTYTQALGSGLSGFVTLDVRHVGDSVSGTSGIGTGLTRPAYTVCNGRMGLRWAGDELALYARNLGGARANLGDLNPISYAPVDASDGRMLRIAVLPPLQVGIELRHSF